METREVKALAIAATTSLQPGPDGWRVPSQSGRGAYRVIPDEGFCSCPDHETRGVACKHVLAVQYTLRRERGRNGAVRVTEQLSMTYTQEWSRYNAAQCEEKARFVELLADLCSAVPQPEQTMGRPRLPLSDMAFATTYKVYSRFSSRRFTSDVRDANARGLIGTTPHFNSVSRYMSNPELTPVLQELIKLSSLPLKSVETDFAVDSSGFSTCRFVRWFNKKYGRETDNRQWVKAHLMCGVKTNVVTGVEVTGWSAADTNYFRPLVRGTAENFAIAEVSADKAYLSHKNVNAVAALGAEPFIPFKSNSLEPTGTSAWSMMYHRFAYERDAFLRSYHKRSNVETTFSMLKAKFGDAVLSKSETGQVNEVLCKVLAHNICVVIAAMHELGVEPRFATSA